MLKKTRSLTKKNRSAFLALSLAVCFAGFWAPDSRAQKDDNHDVDSMVNALFGQSDIFSWTVNGHYTLKEHLLWNERFKAKAARWAEMSKANALRDSEFSFAPMHAPGKLPTRTRKNEIYEGTRVDFSSVHLPDQQSELKFPIVDEIQSTRVALIGFWARSQSPQTIRVSFKLTSSKPGYQIWQSSAKLDSQWRYYAGETEVPPCKSSEYSVAFSAFSPQSTFDIQNNVQLLTMDKPEPIKTSSEKEIDNLIEFIRKDKLTIHVTNAAGEPVPSAKVNVEQLGHEFNFGCVANFTPGKSVNQENCQNKFASLFNCAAFAISWNVIEPAPQKLDFSRIDTSLEWCTEHHMKIMLEDVFSPYSYPDWAPKDALAARTLIKDHIALLMNHFAEKIAIWNICDSLIEAATEPNRNGFCAWVASNNWDKLAVGDRDKKASNSQEMQSPPSSRKMPLGYSAFYSYSQILRWARPPATRRQPVFLCSSEYPENLAQFLPAADKVGSVFTTDGVALHYTMEIGSYERLPKVNDQLRQLGKLAQRPIYVSNLNIASSALSKSSEDKIGEKKQAEYALLIYRLLFSRPNVHGIIWGDFIDENSSGATPKGMLRSDGSVKPVYNDLFDLIHKKWWTHAAGKTDNNGNFVQNVYFGDYQITVTDNQNKTTTKNIQFSKSKPAQLVVTITI